LCYCTLHLQYRPHVPKDYEPIGFSHIPPPEDELPYSHKAGKVITEHHQMSLSLQLPVDLFEDIQSQSTSTPKSQTYLSDVNSEMDMTEDLV
jgi:hypothetical protein